MSWRSASGRGRKNASRKSCALSSSSVYDVPVVGFLNSGVVVAVVPFLFAAYLASFHMFLGHFVASSTCCLCDCLRAFQMIRPFRFLAARYVSQLSSECFWLFCLFSLLASCCTSLHSFVHPSLAFEECFISGVDSLMAACIASTTSSVYLSSAGFVLGFLTLGSSRASVICSFFLFVDPQLRVSLGI